MIIEKHIRKDNRQEVKIERVEKQLVIQVDEEMTDKNTREGKVKSKNDETPAAIRFRKQGIGN
jgi:hypothetical protein